MSDSERLLDQMLSSKVAYGVGQAGQLAKGRLSRVSGAQELVVGALADGVFGFLLGSKKLRTAGHALKPERKRQS